ncbi:DNA repair photolyase [Candidatus Nitrososphaera evergladensis SR1]|uniref:DNA repair photolyase n=1 Tax=Candidatus Nitrososphaera evergladensis SR1 TaxID=1459636 RepID=A0A075MU67_9ARCH|nr:radical SAM protein [Candidatus Nitrososphaera evergladensis]AIF84688.1 DNA repair photolyase [Candidatus Nitrososphaera evergladensis SR1]
MSSGLWYDVSAPRYEAKKAKSIIHPFAVKGYTGMTVNPYQGCQHRCAYCYATYEWSPEFYDKVYAKSNAPEVLEKELQSWKASTINPMMVASATDAYQPAELRYGLTRKCVQVLQKYNVPYYVFTKSTIIERDLELHRRYARNCLVIWSITTANEKIRRIVEPGTPPAERIFAVIKKFTDAGVPCGINVDPIMPLVTDTDEELGAVVDRCKEAGVKYVFGAMLRMRDDIWDRMKLALRLLQVPDGERRYRQIYEIKEELSADAKQKYIACNKEYGKRVTDRLHEIIKSRGLCPDFPDHVRPQDIDRSCTGQMTMLSFVHRDI